MPMEQEKASGPVLVGVNSTIVSPVLGRSLEIFNAGMTKALAHEETRLVTILILAGILCLSVMFLGE